MTPIDHWLYPDLVRFAPEQRAAAIGRARLAWTELACPGVAVVAVTSLTGRWAGLREAPPRQEEPRGKAR